MKKVIIFSLLTIVAAQAQAVQLHDFNYYKNKVEGSLLGAAVGDMLGAPVEFVPSIEEIKELYAPEGITGIESLKKDDFVFDVSGKKIVPYTDDTAMAIVVMNALNTSIKNKLSFNETMEMIAKGFVQDMNNPLGWAKLSRAPGNACIKNVKELKQRIEEMAETSNNSAMRLWNIICNFLNIKKYNGPWWQAGKETDGGCGSVMRAHPFGLSFIQSPEVAIEWAAQHSKITHGAPIAVASCAAFAAGIVAAVENNDPQIIAQKMIEAAYCYDQSTGDLLKNVTSLASSKKANKNETFIYEMVQGWAAHEAVAAGLYTFLRYPNDFKKCVLLGVNTPGDSDSIASIAGALSGAYLGIDAIPHDWIEHLEGAQVITHLADQSVQSQCNNNN